MPENKQQKTTSRDHSKKSILARGCDPKASLWASKAIPPLIGNPEYVPTTNDEDFFNKLKSQKWSVVFFAPGACRYSAAKQAIPGGNLQSQGWTLEQYRQKVIEYQGEKIQIVESLEESKAVGRLEEALALAQETR